MVALLDAMAGRRVLVLGDAVLDGYLRGATLGLCREAPVPVVGVTGREEAPGGAANAAVNAAGLGAAATLLSVVGDDPEARRLAGLLQRSGVSLAGLLPEPGRRTLVKRRIMADMQMLARLDEGSAGPLAAASEARLCARLRELARDAEAVIVSDYGAGTVSGGVVAVLAELRLVAPRVLVVDAKDPAAHRRLRPLAVTPNYGEAMRALGVPLLADPAARAAQAEALGARLLEVTGARLAVLTLDAGGALLFEAGRPPVRTYARADGRAEATGAGDTFTAALTLALVAGASPPAAVELASAAAATVVAKPGTATCYRHELRQRLSGTGKLLDPGGLARWAAAVRAGGLRLVFTNGCFDLLHGGHVSYLSQAKALGDVLVVGVNSDAGVRRLKGPSRPVNGLHDRMRVLAALSCVDHVVPFDGDSPTDLIEAIRPQVYAKGGDHSRETLPEVPLVERLGGELHLLSYVEDHSTSGIIDRIRRAQAASTA